MAFGLPRTSVFSTYQRLRHLFRPQPAIEISIRISPALPQLPHQSAIGNILGVDYRWQLWKASWQRRSGRTQLSHRLQRNEVCWSGFWRDWRMKSAIHSAHWIFMSSSWRKIL